MLICAIFCMWVLSLFLLMNAIRCLNRVSRLRVLYELRRARGEDIKDLPDVNDLPHGLSSTFLALVLFSSGLSFINDGVPFIDIFNAINAVVVADLQPWLFGLKIVMSAVTVVLLLCAVFDRAKWKLWGKGLCYAGMVLSLLCLFSLNLSLGAVHITGDGPRPAVHEMDGKHGFYIEFDDLVDIDSVSVKDSTEDSVPFIRKENTIIINDARHRDKDIVVTWTAEPFGGMKETIRRDENRTLAPMDWIPIVVIIGAWVLARLLWAIYKSITYPIKY